MITIIADFDVKNGKASEFIKLASECAKNTKKEVGCLSYRVYRAEKNGLKFTFIEEWANETAIEKHNEMSHFKTFINSITELLNADPSIRKITRVTQIR